MVVFPNAKINLGLRVVAKRSDGYHDLDTVFYPIPLTDILELITNKESNQPEFSFASSGLTIPGGRDQNLCYKAYQLLKKDHPGLPPIKVHLHKQIPMGAGLGGGSSDGAFMLTLLNEQYGLQLSNEQLKEYALQLGSDCPFFINNQPCAATGRGEIMKNIEISLKGYHLVLVCPGIHVSTKEAFQNIVPHVANPTCEEAVMQPLNEWKNTLINDFETPVFSLYPAIGQIKKKLYENGAAYASMTGTGSTVYGIFDQAPTLDNIFPSHYQIIHNFVS
jgi:4-diphosphocytidyl-2-C-methyl-D-erythritol kinase